MPDMSSTFLGVELQTWVTGGAIVLLVAIAHLALRWWTRRRARTHQDSRLRRANPPRRATGSRGA